ncbi:hypothetical protein AVEN_275488-1 [Araneus ventricosus]|uniref:Uncharacterized protein n=1 Tax=Araneus ventricosus TaxID=182803 RepID=A0A4Y2LAA2_ARAVE|nr:hypothetical protein AVEN_275488-1 [Araneus ventricosus]
MWVQWRLSYPSSMTIRGSFWRVPDVAGDGYLYSDFSIRMVVRPRWPSVKVSQVRNPNPLNIRRVYPSCLERRCQLRCRPRHLTAVQNYEVRP